MPTAASDGAPGSLMWDLLPSGNFQPWRRSFTATTAYSLSPCAHLAHHSFMPLFRPCSYLLQLNNDVAQNSYTLQYGCHQDLGTWKRDGGSPLRGVSRSRFQEPCHRWWVGSLLSILNDPTETCSLPDASHCSKSCVQPASNKSHLSRCLQLRRP